MWQILAVGGDTKLVNKYLFVSVYQFKVSEILGYAPSGWHYYFLSRIKSQAPNTDKGNFFLPIL